MVSKRKLDKNTPVSAATSKTGKTGKFQPRPFAESRDSQELAVTSPEQRVTSPPVDHTPISDGVARHSHVTAPAPIQAKLTIGEPNDRYEQEADQIAEQVVEQLHRPAASRTITATSAPSQDSSLSPEQPSVSSHPIQRKAASETPANPSTELEQQIQVAQSGGQPLAPELQTQMGQQLGADLSRVRIHTDSQADTLNRSIQAKAFTTNQDIFFRNGAYQPNSKAGQKLIAHELVHTVQQGSSPIVQRQGTTPTLSAAHQSLQTSTRFLQRKRVIVTAKTSIHKREEGKDQGKIKSTNISPGSIVEVSDTDSEHIKDSQGNIRWFYKKGGGGYIRASKVLVLSGSATPSGNPKGEEDLLGGFNESVLGTTEGGLSDKSGAIEDEHKEAEKSGMLDPNAESPDTSELDTAAGAFGVTTGLLGMALSFKKIFANNEKGLAEVITRVGRSALVGLGKAAAGISGIVGANSEENSSGAERASAASEWTSGFAGAIETLSGAVKTVRKIVEVIRIWGSDDEYSKPERAKLGSEIVSSVLSTAKGAVESVKRFMDIFDSSTEGLAQAIPGLGIAISAVKMIVQGYYLSESAVHLHKIRTISPDLMAEKRPGNVSEEEFDRARKDYKSDRAKLSNLEHRKQSKEAKNESRQAAIDSLEQKEEELEQERKTIEDNLTQWRQQQKQSPSKELEEEIKRGERNIKRIDDELNGTKWTSGIRQKKRDLTTKRDATQRKVTGADKDIERMRGSVASYDVTQDDLEEIDLAKELKSGNRKRIVRQSIHLGTELTKIAAEIATLSGAGAHAGIALKASAAGVDVSLPFFRALKQYGRKKAAKNQAKGKQGGLSQSLFNADKSDMAKLSERKRHTLTIFKMVNNLNNDIPAPGTAPTEEQSKKIKRVQVFIEATGCDTQQLYRLNGDPEKQAALILQSFYKREF